MKASIEADLKPTENAKHVEQAIKKIFPDAKLEVLSSEIKGHASLNKFAELVKKQELQGIIKRELEDKSYLDLHKIAAVAGKIGLDEEFPLGKIRVHIENSYEFLKEL